MKYTEENILLFLKDFKRFCFCHKKFHSEKSNGECLKTCPLHVYKTDHSRKTCAMLMLDEPEQMIKIIMEWRKSNPERSYKTVFLQKFPYANIDGGTPTVCAGELFGFRCEGGLCRDCWNTEHEGRI